MPQYEIVFFGELVDGAQPERVKANLGKLFQADAQRLELLLSGRRLVLKNNLDADIAEKYRATMERAGARVQVVAMTPAVQEQVMEEVELAPPPDEPTWTRKTAPAGRTALPRVEPAEQAGPRDVYAAAFVDVVAPDFELARPGSDMQDPKPAPLAPNLDLSGLSLAPAGSDMGQAPKPKARPAPDTSHLKVV
ncbi:hypothetical protein EGJ27_13785 [Pseudomonas sp. v388]|uniref:hypothetical protein n=1 Tax=Pseudomonas sp. v388 TaxID=2479849 RepID=UPI000F76B08C|nr:hypothetical protein [Pseudomonas sp. v388]RRV06823.1 hypothetical protein EGJ27_13785 [Pseudomonas sp. v388]